MDLKEKGTTETTGDANRSTETIQANRITKINVPKYLGIGVNKESLADSSTK